MPQSDPSRTETATSKRRNKARDKGNVAKSQELPKAIIVLAGLVVLWIYLEYIGRDLLALFEFFFSHTNDFQPTKEVVNELFFMVSSELAVMILPVILFMGVASFLIMRWQVGPLWTTQVFSPKFDKFLDPIGGMKRMFMSPQTAVRLLKSILMAGAIGVAPYIVLRDEMENIAPLFYQNVNGVVQYILTTGGKMVMYALVPMIVIALADLVYTRWDYEENLKMTKDEVKDERKQAEGDPKVKQRQKQKMMEMSMKRMMQDVPKADVVITNPTHFAIAIKYDPSQAPAPMVLAKGVDAVAQKIKEIARENNVPIRENRPLARALYKAVEVGDMIPEEMYKAVAAILAQLHKFKR